MAADIRRLAIVYLALLALLSATMLATWIGLGRLGPFVSLGIAVAKASLVFWFFMELRQAAGLVRLFAVAGVFWILLMFSLGMGDWLTR
jgi:cytochrome c oxidase subunit 4